MSISDLLLLEFDAEAKTTRTMLERVPEDNKDFTPHPKSMPLNKLAPHVAELAWIWSHCPDYARAGLFSKDTGCSGCL